MEIGAFVFFRNLIVLSTTSMQKNASLLDYESYNNSG